MLTGCRPKDTLGVRFGDLDMARRIWPLKRAAWLGDIVIALSEPALAICQSRRQGGADAADLLFRKADGDPLRAAELLSVMRKMGTDIVPHGLRYGFDAWRGGARRHDAVGHGGRPGAQA